MLRQSVMGSDLSYEDLMEDRTLEDMYDAQVTGEDTVLDRPCWLLTLTANAETWPTTAANSGWMKPASSCSRRTAMV